MLDELSKRIREYAKSQPTDLKKQYYINIADALIDEDFM